jgi:hypothetical protein
MGSDWDLGMLGGDFHSVDLLGRFLDRLSTSPAPKAARNSDIVPDAPRQQLLHVQR